MWSPQLLRALSEPLRTLYLRGPTALYFFGGMPPAEICVRLAPRTTHHDWLMNPRGCEEMIERDIESWLVFVWFVLYVYVFWHAVRFALLLLLSQLRAALNLTLASLALALARLAPAASPTASPSAPAPASPRPLAPEALAADPAGGKEAGRGGG